MRQSCFYGCHNGSYYYALTVKTEAMVQKVFISSPEKVVIYENNMDWLTDSSVIPSCNGSLRELKPEKDYTIEAVGNETSKSNILIQLMRNVSAVRERIHFIWIRKTEQVITHQQNSRLWVLLSIEQSTRISSINLEEQQYYHGTSLFQVTVDDNTQLSCGEILSDAGWKNSFQKR